MRAIGLNHRDAEAGVTLVEILVVLSIIAITTGAAMLRLGFGHSEDETRAAVAAMARTITAASDDALQTGQDRVLQLGPKGYRVIAANATTEPVWQTVPGLSFQPVGDRNQALRLSADGASPAFDLRLQAGSEALFLHFDGLKARVEAEP